jgi:predicted  nucleic acid-binding Zn-ribbon protein
LNPQLRPLIDLQALDLRILEIIEQQRKIPQQIDATEAPLKESRRRMEDSSASAEALVKDRRSLERDLEAHEAQVQKLRGRLAELKTNKEYQAHLFEIEMANKKKSEMEDHILSLMDRIEKAQQDIKQAQTSVAEAERAFGESQKTLEALSDRLAAELAQLEEKRTDLTSLLNKDMLDRYSRLKAMRKDLALAPVRSGICFGCRLQLPPQLVAEVKRSDSLLSCSYCNRILYWEGDSPQLAPVGGEAPQSKPGQAKGA